MIKINELIQNYLKENVNEKNHALKWDYLKCEIRGFTISYASYRAKEKREYIDKLKNKLYNLESNLSEDNMIEYKEAKQELDQLYNEKAQGHYVRSRTKFIEETPENLKYYKKLEIKNSQTKYIKTLYKGKELITNFEEILNEQKEFYSDLYSLR